MSFSVVNEGDGLVRTNGRMLSFMTYRPSKKLRNLLATLAALALITTSCGGGSADSAVDTAAASPAPADQAFQSEEATAEGSFVATTVSGGQIDFGSFEGQDVVLWFWAPW